MNLDLEEHHKIGFYTATILEWKKLLKPDKYKDIIAGSLRFIAEEKRAKIYGFVNYAQSSSSALENRFKMEIRRGTT